VKFAFIQDMEKENYRKPRDERFPVDFMCEMLEVSRSGYYAWSGRGVSEHAEEDQKLTLLVLRVHHDHNGLYGIDRITGELAHQGHRHSPKRVRRLARAAGLTCKHPRPYVTTTVQDRANARGLVDLVGRDFFPDRPDELWYGDITYVFTRNGWVYVATVIDGFSRRVVGWAVDDNMRDELTAAALEMAIANRRPTPGQVVFHSDRGSQYTSSDFRDLCFANGIIPSVGHTGICYDNAAAESWNALYKKELIHLHVWDGLDHVRKASFHWIETYYNRKRIQKQLGYLSPVGYEEGFDNRVSQVA
jgi:putative transposase